MTLQTRTESLFANKSDEVAIQGTLRYFGRAEEAKRRYLAGNG